MKRIFLAIASLAMTVVMCLTSLVGCNLIVVDSERDMNQVVATVSIGEGAPTETIYKKEMVLSYLNYYYQYEQAYGYTRQQTIELIIENLINNRVFVQYAIKTFAEENGDTNIEWKAEKYLTQDEKDEATYSAYKDMDELIESYVADKEGDKVGDTLTETVRVVPTGATNKDELTIDEKREFVQKGIDVTSDGRRQAFVKVVKLLDANELLGDEYVANDVTTTDYYKDTLKAYYEQQLISKFEKKITDQARAKVTYDDVANEYKEIYETQVANDNTAFVTALGSASASAPILYGGFNGYGFAYNLLLGASDELLAEFDEWKAENPNADKATQNAKREEIFSKITVKDLRSSWVHSGYDFEKREGTSDYVFTGDYTLTSPENSLPFVGKVTELTAPDAEDKEYRVEADEMSLDEFIVFMENYIYGAPKGGAVADNRKINATTANDEYDQRVKELMFAFSTDSSDTALNTYKGYAVKPLPDGAETEEYVIEYAVAGRELINMGEYSYIMVATRYGYHIMFFSEKIDQTYDYPTLESFLDKEYGDKTEQEWRDYLADMLASWEDFEDTNNYLYILHNQLASAKVNKALTEMQTEVLNSYVYSGEDFVVKYEYRYADLFA